MTGRIFLCYLLFLINAVPLASQKEYLLQADHAFENGQFQKAIRLYTQYNKINRDQVALGKRGIAHFNYNLVDKAIADFTAAKKLGNNDPILYLKMGQSKQFLKAFDEASFFYQKYLELSEKDAPYRKMAELEIKNCVFSALETFETAGTLIQSFGDDVNSRYDEIYPIQSPTFGNVFYFSSNRNKSNFDILSYTLSEDGLWSKNDMSEKPFNNGYHNVALDVDGADINAMLYSEVDMNQETIQFASFDLSGQDIVVQLPPEIFDGAKDISIVNHNMLVFASKKLSGYGGYDIFTVSYKDGAWTTPQNLGVAINSPFDEICPFYSHNLNHFYFSSNRPYCFGGYDIYYCDISNKKLPVNMGYGINSHGDDLHFNIDDAGHSVTFSSNRKTGLGGYDLYFAYLQDIKNMGQRDSLVFEYLINPAEEFVQIKNKDNLVALNTKNDKVKSSVENKSIEIITKLEAVKERPEASDDIIDDLADVNNVEKSDIEKSTNKTISEKEKEVASEINSSEKDLENPTQNSRPEETKTEVIDNNSDKISKTKTVVTVQKEKKTQNAEDLTNNMPTSTIDQTKTEKIVQESEQVVTDHDTNNKVDEEVEKNTISQNETQEKESKTISSPDTPTSQKETKEIVIDEEKLDNQNNVLIPENRKTETTDQSRTSIQKNNSNENPVSNTSGIVTEQTIKEDNKKVDVETKSTVEENSSKVSKINSGQEEIVTKEIETTKTSDIKTTETRTTVDVSSNNTKDVVVKKTMQKENTPPITTPDNKSDTETTTENPSQKIDVLDTVESPSKNSIEEKRISDQRTTERKPKSIKRKVENLKEEKLSGLVKERDFKRIEKSWTNFAQPQTLYYQDRQDLVRGENMVKLNQIIVSEYETNSTFVLLAHTDDTELGLPEYVQYNTFKRALKVAEYINASGIDKSRIRIESLANNYPLIKSDIAGEKINSLYAHNKRVDVLIYNGEAIKEDDVINDASIPGYAFDRKYELFRSIREGTYYSIEIASAERIFKNAILRLYNDIYIRRDDLDGLNKYYIGIYTQEEDAEEVAKQLSETSSPYAKVVKFVNGIITKE